jgi:hypothetical protein
MGRYLQTIAQVKQTLTASADIVPLDLPVNPLSFVLLSFDITRANPSALAVYKALDTLIDQVTSVSIAHKGENIISGSLRDIMAMNYFYQHVRPGLSRFTDASGARDQVVFPICLGRRMYDPVSCFPATTRGNLKFLMTAGATPAAYSVPRWQLETCELIEAQPSEHVKYVTSSRVSVAGIFEQVLPIGNAILGCLLFDTGLRDNITDVYSWGQVKLKKDSVEQYYPNSDVETLAGFTASQLEEIALWPSHQHQGDGAQAGLFNSDQAKLVGAVGLKGYFYLDFDPLRDGTYQLETEGAAQLSISGNGDEATAVRVLSLERRMLGG